MHGSQLRKKQQFTVCQNFASRNELFAQKRFYDGIIEEKKHVYAFATKFKTKKMKKKMKK